jgi:outer membrane receptor protein involved in Fe transport
VTDDIELNAALYVRERRTTATETSPTTRLDVGVTWRPTERIEVAAWGQNLLDHSELALHDPLFTSDRQHMPRTFYVQATIRY